jgi:putative flippase GtrA
VNCFVSALDKLLLSEDLRVQMGEAANRAVMLHQTAHEDYLASFKRGIEATAGFQKRSFAGRYLEFIKVVFRGNKVLRFILAGGTSALSQIAILYLFTDILGLWYLYASILSFVIALFISFTLQKFWAFRDKAIRGVHAQFMKYAMIIFVGLLLNTTLMFLLVDLLHFWYILAQIITGALIAVFNFLSYRKYIFK